MSRTNTAERGSALLSIAHDGERVLRSAFFRILANLLALALLAYSFSQWIGRGLRPPAAAEESSLVIDRLSEVTPSAAEAREILRASHLFGIASPDAPRAIEALPQSSLDVVLSGVVVRGGQSVAILSVQGQPEQPWTVGREILAGVVLQAVLPDRVIVRRSDGALEFIPLKDHDMALAPNAGATLSTAGRQAAPMPIEKTPSQRYSLDRSALGSQTLLELLSQAQFAPAPQGGLMLREVRPGGLYEKLGLRPGDVLKTVNGQTLENLEQAQQLYHQFIEAGQKTIELEIMRAGRPLSLRYQLQ
jgi:general secretion pathway protein C